MSDWWKDFFGADYLRIYKSRAESAAAEAEFIRKRLRLRRGQRVLDLCCGYGRHAILLAAAGLRVTGYDQSRFFLSKARRDARRREVDVSWVRGDARELVFEREFDAVINMFTSFGYFAPDGQNHEVIRGVAAALNPNGQFLLDTVNRERIIRNSQPVHWQKVGRGLLLENRKINWETGYMHCTRTLIESSGDKKQQQFSIRLYTLAELISLMSRFDLEVENVFGGFDGAEYTPDSPRVILTARKPRS